MDDQASKHYIPIVKAVTEKRLVYGVALVPEKVDIQKDIMDADVIQGAAHEFLAAYQVNTQLGVQHKEYHHDLSLVESFIAPVDFQLGDRMVTKGSWVVCVKVHSDTIWDKVKKGELTGFSVKGVAKVIHLTQSKPEPAAAAA